LDNYSVAYPSTWRIKNSTKRIKYIIGFTPECLTVYRVKTEIFRCPVRMVRDKQRPVSDPGINEAMMKGFSDHPEGADRAQRELPALKIYGFAN
jgi:hypothetical protein